MIALSQEEILKDILMFSPTPNQSMSYRMSGLLSHHNPAKIFKSWIIATENVEYQHIDFFFPVSFAYSLCNVKGVGRGMETGYK